MHFFTKRSLTLYFVVEVHHAGAMSMNQAGNGKVRKPIQKVAVIGSGIAGLTLKHALENSELSRNVAGDAVVNVSLFDSRDGLNYEAGAGIQLNGGMAVYKVMNSDLQKDIVKASLPLTTIRSRAKPREWQWPWEKLYDLISGPREKQSYQTLLEIELKDAVTNSDAETRDQLIVDGELMSYSILRGALQEVLIENLPANTEPILFGKTLIGISGSKSDGIFCEFNDNSTEGPFDLVVGCDGIKSAVKEYVETGRISNAEDAVQRNAIYSGIRIQYAVADGNELEDAPDNAELRQYFGDGSYALAGVYGAGSGKPPSKGAFAIFRDQNYIGPFKKPESRLNEKVQENSDWTQDRRSDEDARGIMISRVSRAGVPLDEVQPIIENADRFFELGVYFHSPISSLNGWKKEVEDGHFAVLCGDAAHAMPPFLGQGANQAVQDAYCLASKIYEYNSVLNQNIEEIERGESSVDRSIKDYLDEYEKIRWYPTASITAKAAILGYLETGGGFISEIRDWVFFVLGKIGVAKKVFLDGATPRY